MTDNRLKKSPVRNDPARPYDVIVCGGGHAGCEAALAAARMGADTLLITGNLDTIAQMSCNPAIGGLAKGHIVREIDALGGEMAVNADTTAIQFRLLNGSKGEAVQAPRAQCDKKAYQYRMKHVLELQNGLTLFQAVADELLYKDGIVQGVKTDLGVSFYGKTVILTTGTFLRGLLHIGLNKNEGGRLADFSARHLSQSLEKAGIELRRFKTGTPARIAGHSIDFSKCEEQQGDADPTFFAFYDTRTDDPMFHVEQLFKIIPELFKTVNETTKINSPPDHVSGSSGDTSSDLFHVEQNEGSPTSPYRKLGWRPGHNQVSCWVTHTGPETGAIIRANLHLSPMYSGEIKGIGPRYCPSIEDKFVRFPHKETHRLFLEPEGLNTDEWYINGLSTSLPFETQQAILRSIPALENAVMLRPAYAVEYDYAPPTQLWPSLESRVVHNLFCAGQINGTSGYEEAAGQGLIAGVNAVLKLRGEEPLVLRRDESYLGVLIDDLVTKGTTEPYRMFTSRAEYRLALNHASAEIRMLPHARRCGLLDADRLRRIEAKAAAVLSFTQGFEEQKIAGGTIAQALRRLLEGEGVPEGVLPAEFEALSQSARQEIIYRVRYKGYLEREQRLIEKMRHLENIRLPKDISYKEIRGLRLESAQKLDAVKPENLGQASRISGVSPADISLLMIAIRASGK